MIISASYKTDIPTFYGQWFMNRLRAGYCKMVNPYGRQVYQINLRHEPFEGQEGVDGIVFWTKNIGPVMKYLPEIRDKGYPFAVQHTINGYPRDLESRVIDYDRAIERMHELAQSYQESHIIWRYDPILITSLTPIEWHKENFERLAMGLKGSTHEVVVSFAQIYKKTRRNLDEAAQMHGFEWHTHESLTEDGDSPDPQAIALLMSLANTAKSCDMEVRVCSQERYLITGMVQEARCIDASWFGQRYKKHGNRAECACSASRDIGEYDTCPHGCVYCYAVQHHEKALDRYKKHNPEREFLFEPEFPVSEAVTSVKQTAARQRASLPVVHQQQSMFADE